MHAASRIQCVYLFIWMEGAWTDLLFCSIARSSLSNGFGTLLPYLFYPLLWILHLPHDFSRSLFLCLFGFLPAFHPTNPMTSSSFDPCPPVVDLYTTIVHPASPPMSPSLVIITHNPIPRCTCLHTVYRLRLAHTELSFYIQSFLLIPSLLFLLLHSPYSPVFFQSIPMITILKLGIFILDIPSLLQSVFILYTRTIQSPIQSISNFSNSIPASGPLAFEKLLLCLWLLSLPLLQFPIHVSISHLPHTITDTGSS